MPIRLNEILGLTSNNQAPVGSSGAGTAAANALENQRSNRVNEARSQGYLDIARGQEADRRQEKSDNERQKLLDILNAAVTSEPPDMATAKRAAYELQTKFGMAVSLEEPDSQQPAQTPTEPAADQQPAARAPLSAGQQQLSNQLDAAGAASTKGLDGAPSFGPEDVNTPVPGEERGPRPAPARANALPQHAPPAPWLTGALQQRGDIPAAPAPAPQQQVQAAGPRPAPARFYVGGNPALAALASAKVASAPEGPTTPPGAGAQTPAGSPPIAEVPKGARRYSVRDNQGRLVTEGLIGGGEMQRRLYDSFVPVIASSTTPEEQMVSLGAQDFAYRLGRWMPPDAAFKAAMEYREMELERRQKTLRAVNAGRGMPAPAGATLTGVGVGGGKDTSNTNSQDDFDQQVAMWQQKKGVPALNTAIAGVEQVLSYKDALEKDPGTMASMATLQALKEQVKGVASDRDMKRFYDLSWFEQADQKLNEMIGTGAVRKEDAMRIIRQFEVKHRGYLAKRKQLAKEGASWARSFVKRRSQPLTEDEAARYMEGYVDPSSEGEEPSAPASGGKPKASGGAQPSKAGLSTGAKKTLDSLGF